MAGLFQHLGNTSGICLTPVPELLALSHIIIWEEMSWIGLWIFQAFPCLLPLESGKIRQQREALRVQQHLEGAGPLSSMHGAGEAPVTHLEAGSEAVMALCHRSCQSITELVWWIWEGA